MKTKKTNEQRSAPLLLKLLTFIRLPVATFLVEFLYWKLTDIIRAIKQGKNKTVHLYGIKCFVGNVGTGKTMSLVRYLEQHREKYGDRIYIATNFYYKNQDFAIENWEVLKKDYDKPVIFGYDELQNEFNSRNYRTFPIALMQVLTQNRKKNGKQIVYTAQDFDTVDKNFRRLTTEVVQCHTFFGRLGLVSFYTYRNYLHLMATVNVETRLKNVKPMTRSIYVQSDYLRNLYDSYQVLEAAMGKEYLGLDEMNAAGIAQAAKDNYEKSG
jgi:hypothetical protein